MSKMKVAVVGSGIAGLACAWKLAPHAQISIFEQADRAGGHIHTHQVVDSEGVELKIDTGFIMFNRAQYPRFCSLLDELGVEVAESEMSFSFPDGASGTTFASAALNQFRGLRRLKMRFQLWKFHRLIESFEGELMMLSLGDFLQKYSFSDDFVQIFLFPLVKALFSMTESQVRELPMQRVFQFLRVHGLDALSPRAPWLFVPGGYDQYVQKILSHKNIQLYLNSKVEVVNSDASLICKGKKQQFDAVVLACEADIALKLLSEPSDLQQDLLGCFDYKLNEGFLHADPSLDPNRGSMMIHESEKNSPACMSLYLNALLGLKTKQNLFMTLNPSFKVQNRVADLAYRHLVLTPEVLTAQQNLHQLNQKGPVYFAGAYWRYFHEDALKSAEGVARVLIQN